MQAGDRQPAFARVLCGVDGSDAADEAVRQAAALAGTLELLAVVQPAHGSRPVFTQERAEAALARAEQIARALGRSARTRLAYAPGDVSRPLLEAAAECDLVAVGTHEVPRPLAILTGTAASRLVHRSPRPVLVARPRRRTAAFPDLLLLASDGSPEAERAARLGLRIFAATGCRTAVVEVDGHDAVEAALREAGAEPVLVRAGGRPLRTIVATAAEMGADLVVTGSRGRTGLRALASVSERLVHRAPCSVLVARGPAVERAIGEPAGRAAQLR